MCSRGRVARGAFVVSGLSSLLLGASLCAQTGQPFGIRAVDAATGRGVPLVELETTNRLLFVTDSGGWVAFNEPGLMGQPVFFSIRSHGYTFPKDGFGFAGVALTPTPGGRAEVRLTRVNIAERLYRITGEGIYRDSVLLGEKTPRAEPLGSGKVAGQDSTFCLPYRGTLFWFWGDTGRLRYPLGHFWMAGAVSDLPARNGLDPALGVNLRYFTDKEGFSRPMCRLGVERGVIWSDAFAALPDATGKERLVCHYAHMEALEKMLGHGLALYDDAREEFGKIAELPMDTLWRFPAQAHPFKFRDGEVEYLYLGGVFPVVRVPATLAHFKNLESYEAWSCLEEGSTPEAPRVARNVQGRVNWRWSRNVRPVDGELERTLIAAGKLTAAEACLNPVDAESGATVQMHRGSITWNAYRKKWVMIAGQRFGTSLLGEIWYAEAAAPTGPWKKARKIVTHDKYSFYNPVAHAFFEEEGGRRIYFEGTYTQSFSGNPVATPRYDYTTIMYRLDLDDPRLAAVRE